MCLLKDTVQKSVKEGRICQPPEAKFLVQLVVRLLFLVGTCTHTPQVDINAGPPHRSTDTEHFHEPKWHQQLSGLRITKSDSPRKCKVLKGMTCSMILLAGKSEMGAQSDLICRVFGLWLLEEWLALQKNEEEYKRLICAAWRVTLESLLQHSVACRLVQLIVIAGLQWEASTGGACD